MKLEQIFKQNPYIKKSYAFDRKLLQIPLKESFEELVFLEELFHREHLPVIFGNASDGNEKRIFYSRKTVAYALLNAATILFEMGYILKIEHAYRTVITQQTLFLKRVREVRRQYPGIDDREVKKISNIYTAGIPLLAAHTAGAAVDVTLLTKDLKTMDMGSPYPFGGVESTTDYQKLPVNAKHIRALLCQVMHTAGFTNYPFEYWHFSIGDVAAAYMRKDEYAYFGPVAFDSKKHLSSFDSVKNMYQFFSGE